MTFARRQHRKSLQIQALPHLKRAWEICTGRYFFEKNSAELQSTTQFLGSWIARNYNSTLAKACKRTSG
jgi:hypothetical protein